jgi:hypothetical protein
MADDRHARISHASTVDGLVHQESPLDRARALKQQFNRAANPQEQQQSRETEQASGGGQQGLQTGRDDSEKIGKKLEKKAATLDIARKAKQTLKPRRGKSTDSEHER